VVILKPIALLALLAAVKRHPTPRTPQTGLGFWNVHTTRLALATRKRCMLGPIIQQTVLATVVRVATFLAKYHLCALPNLTTSPAKLVLTLFEAGQ
jgi:hypothetical protein